jgi:hypothetical protein
MKSSVELKADASKEITLYLRNKEFGVPKEILIKAKFFKNLFNDTVVSGPIILNRSPKIFSHVIEALYDSEYPYPIKYLYELDFYLVPLKNVNIYDPFKDCVKVIMKIR